METKEESLKFYSQHGEDRILYRIFGGTYKGSFIDVGAMDGIHLSNTYFLEKRGWEGICIEANPDYIELLKNNRKEVVHAVVSRKNKQEVIFYANKWGAFSTVSEETKKKFEKKFTDWCTDWKQVKVPMRTLDNILEDYAAHEHFDVLSIDCEGEDLAVLEGFNLAKYRPRIAIVESLSVTTDNKIKTYMNKFGYTYAKKLEHCNMFFCSNKKDVPIIKNAKFPYTVSTQHPLGSPV